MRKTLANIALTLLLAVPVFSLVVLVSTDRQKASLVYQLAFPGDFEDHQDDTDPSRDHETAVDGDILMEKYSLLQLPLRLKQRESRQGLLFKEHHREVSTPPPQG